MFHLRKEEFISLLPVFSIDSLGRSNRCLRPTCAYKSYGRLTSEKNREASFVSVTLHLHYLLYYFCMLLLQFAFFAFVAAKSLELRSVFTVYTKLLHIGELTGILLKWSQDSGAD